MGKGLTVPQKLEALQRIATGEPLQSIGDDLGRDKSSLSRLAKKEESRKFIEEQSKRMLSSLPDIVEAREIGVQIVLKLAKYFAGEEDHDAQEIIDRIKTTTTMKMLSRRDKKAMRQTLKENKTPALQLFEILSKQSSDYLRAVGILPSQSPSLFIQNIYQDNRKQVFSPRVMEMIGKFGESLVHPDPGPKKITQPQNSEPLGQ